MGSIQKSRLIVGIFLALALLLIVNLSAAAPPGQPTLYTPDDNWASNDNTPYFEWENGSDAENHRLQIATGPDFTTIVYDNSNINDNFDNFDTHLENALPDGTYWWRVAAENNGGENWSGENRTFTIDNVVPPAPSLYSPDNNENINDNTPNLTWENLDLKENTTPVCYYVAVSDNSEFPYENENSGWISDWILYDNYQVENELADGNWFWRVRARDNAGNVGDWSDNFFCVDVSMPSLVSPIDGTVTNENTPTFTWENKAVVDNYEIWIDNDSTFSSPITKDNTADNIYDNNDTNYPENGWADENWFWRVRAFNPDNSHFSEVWTLLIDTKAPSAPSSSTDDGLVTSDNTPTIDWSSVTDESYSATGEAAGVENYEIWVDNDSDFSSTVTKENLSTNSWTPSSELAEDNYSYKIKVWDKAGNEGDFSTTWTFRVDITPPEITEMRAPSALIGKYSATIKWTTDDLADSEVEYKKTTESSWSSSSSSTFVTSHSIELTGLSAGTTYDYKVKSTNEAGNDSTSTSAQFTTSALEAPTSSVDNISPYWQTSTPFTITATASDNDGTVENVTLWYRYRENSGASWGSWDNFGADNSSPWSWAFDAPDNDGYYEFYTRATDDDDQTEAAPSTADENAGVDTVLPTISSVQINGENTVTPSTSVVISIVAQDPDNLSGLDQMRFSNDNENWTDWEPFASENDYVLPAGDENKRVYVKVKDNAGNESAVMDNWIVLETGLYVESLGTIAENENKLADFGQFGLLVTGINLFAKDNIDNVQVEVKVVQEKPAEISEAAPGTATYYFKVETNASEENLDNIEIRFDVAKSWLDGLGIEAADVKLWKLDNTDNTWQEVSTTIVDENASHVHFSATVPSLSWFAVTGEKPAAPIPYWAVGVGVIIIVISIVLIWWWWKKQAPPAEPPQGVGVATGFQAHSERALNRKEPRVTSSLKPLPP